MFWDNDQYSKEDVDDAGNPFPRMISDAEFVLYNFKTGEVITDVKYEEKPSAIIGCDKINQLDFVDIDKTIFDPVCRFNDMNYKTSFSCGGHFITEMNLVKIDDMFLKQDKTDMFNIWNYINYNEPYIQINVPYENKVQWGNVVNNISIAYSKGIKNYDLENLYINIHGCHSCFDEVDDNTDDDTNFRTIRIGGAIPISYIGDCKSEELFKKYINMDPGKVNYDNIKKDIIKICTSLRNIWEKDIIILRKEFDQLSKLLPELPSR